MARRTRKQHNPHRLQCPHCKETEKWCKNLSDLIQHINVVHLDLFHTTTVDPAPPHSPHPPTKIHLLEASKMPLKNIGNPNLEADEADEIDRDAPGVQEPHTTINGALFGSDC